VPDGAEQLSAATLTDKLIYTAGVLLFAWWLIRTSLGRKALADAPPRRNRMPPYTPFIPFAIWLLGTAVIQQFVRQVVGTLGGWRDQFLDNFIYCVGATITVFVILAIARFTFARGLRGFGLRPWTIPRDFGWAFVDLFAVWPIVLAMIVVTIEIGKRLLGPKFEIPQHMGLELITESPALPLQILIIVLAVVIAPVVEEMLFRGLVQTTLRSYLGRPWLAIVFTSVLFAAVHDQPTHWPALFALAMGLGYSYEKSGSLFRPIFMHALFNGITIAAALAESAPT
jgi:membrane protease YdiL (CAAX protease family)